LFLKFGIGEAMRNAKPEEPKRLNLVAVLVATRQSIHCEADSSIKELIEQMSRMKKKRSKEVESPSNPEHPGFKPVA
jgi:hypothetical protein